MGTVETRSKGSSGCSSPSPENDKNELREALCALKSGVLENGVGLSSHEDQVFGDGGVVQVVKSRVFETMTSVQKEFVGKHGEDSCQGLADSEMNGVSSLLKMRGSGRSLMFSSGGESDSAGKLDVPIADTSENKDLEMEDLGDEGYGFSAGDFVWGKIKSHPWWPGRIYNPSDASDFALKLRQRNRLLVAYFGDGTFAWCHPSQLKPFADNFEDMAMQSSSRAFVNAVQEAVNEVGRVLDLKMSYSWDAKKTRSEFTPPLASNYGIKEGVLIPVNGIDRLSDVLIDPAELLSRVKQLAEIIAIANVLELEILKARLSAFYLLRGGYKLPNYEVPQSILGLEDSLVNETVDVGSSKGVVEAPIQGPFEEEYSTLPLSPKSSELSHAHGISGNRLNHRIKQKSIAEIMGEDKDLNTKIKEVDATEKAMVKRKRKGSVDAITSKPVQKRKWLLPCTDRSVVSAESYGSGGKDNSDKGTVLQSGKKEKAIAGENASNGGKNETDEERRNREQNEKGSLSRERKKSKYLSPPFTIPIREQRKGEIETGSPKVSGKAQLSEPVTSGSDQPLKSTVPLKCDYAKANQETFPKELAMIAQDPPHSSNYQTPKGDENKTIDTTKIQVASGDVLAEVRRAAIFPQVPRDINSLEKVVDFIFIYRNSLYHQGSYYKVYKKHQPGKKRKKPESDLGMLTEDQNQTDHISPSNDSMPKKRRKNSTTSGMPEEKQAFVTKTNKRRTDENTSATALLVSFGPESSLPSKSDLITLYNKFGSLNESETTVFSNRTARVLFLKASNAEKALNHSQNENPFGSSKVSFRLHYLSAGSKSEEHGEKSKSKASSKKKKDKTPANTSTSLSPGSEAAKLNYIQQKLQSLTSMLEASDGKSPDMKTKLESEMKGLLEDVNKMVESSSS